MSVDDINIFNLHNLTNGLYKRLPVLIWVLVLFACTYINNVMKRQETLILSKLRYGSIKAHWQRALD
jgi:hypothetical protein